MKVRVLIHLEEAITMKLEGEQVLLRIQLRNTDKSSWFSPPAAEAIVRRARAEGMAGATIFRGIYGLDCRGQILDGAGWTLVEHLPVVVEIVDEASKVGGFLTIVKEFLREGLATLERAHILHYRHEGRAPGGNRTPSGVPARIEPLSTLPSEQEFPIMKTGETGQLVRVFVGDSDTWNGEPLYQAIVLRAKALGLAGATVLRGPMGFGASSRVHSSKLLELSSDLPIVIEIVDVPEKIQTILPFLDEVVAEGMVTIEEVKVLRYRHDDGTGH